MHISDITPGEIYVTSGHNTEEDPWLLPDEWYATVQVRAIHGRKIEVEVLTPTFTSPFFCHLPGEIVEVKAAQLAMTCEEWESAGPSQEAIERLSKKSWRPPTVTCLDSPAA